MARSWICFNRSRTMAEAKALPPGDYTVAWRATSVDTHRTEGRYGFMLHG